MIHLVSRSKIHLVSVVAQGRVSGQIDNAETLCIRMIQRVSFRPQPARPSEVAMDDPSESNAVGRAGVVASRQLPVKSLERAEFPRYHVQSCCSRAVCLRAVVAARVGTRVTSVSPDCAENAGAIWRPHSIGGGRPSPIVGSCTAFPPNCVSRGERTDGSANVPTNSITVIAWCDVTEVLPGRTSVHRKSTESHREVYAQWS